MGADGGTIPKRCELVKARKKTEKVDRETKNATKWKNCQLTQQPLKKPVIACRLGNLYNKEAVIEAILTKKIGSSAVASHIKGLKDFKELKLTNNKDYKKNNEAKGDEYLDHNQTEFLCPVSTVPMNGINNFIVNWKCGCVFSERALQEVKTNICHGCGGAWDPEDSVMLYPESALLEEYKNKLEAERLEKKNKKAAAKEASMLAGFSQVSVENGSDPVTDEKQKKHEVASKKLVGEKRKVNEPYSIQTDDTKTEAFKKMFTSHENAKKQKQGHWVTYNPLYF